MRIIASTIYLYLQANEEAETKQFERRGGWRMFKGETDTPAHVGDLGFSFQHGSMLTPL